MPVDRVTQQMRSWPFLLLAYGCAGLAMAGIILPLLPTTPFLLIAAWAAPKGSPQLHAWLYRHHRLGPLLRDWREHRVIPLRAKVAAVTLLPLSWLLILIHADSSLIPMVTGSLFVIIGSFILTRPSSLPDSLQPAGYREADHG